MMVAKQIGKKLRELRGTKTINDVAKDTGIGPTALSNYENGYRVPRDPTKVVLAQYYGVNIDDLFFSPYSTISRENGGENQ